MDQTSDKPKPAKLFYTTYCPSNTDYESRSPVIFAHGAAATNATWNSVKEAIGDKTKRKIICIDQRNHGNSEWADVVTMEHNIVDLENLMSELKLSKAIWLGHSYGGRSAMGLAFKRPDLVEKLILEDAFFDVSGQWEKKMKKMLGIVELIKKLPKTMSEAKAKGLIWSQVGNIFPEEVKIFQEKFNTVLPFYKDKETGLFKCFFDLDIVKKLGNLQFDLTNNPTYEGKSLMMTAEKSRLIQESDLEKLRKHLPQSQEVYMDGISHTLHIENPAQFIDVVSNFINED